MIADLLAEEAERRGLLSDGQYGRRKRRSVVNAAAIVVDRAQVAWREGRIAGILWMDSKADSPSVGRGRLTHTMRGKGMDGDLIRWTASFVTEQRVEIVIEPNVMERHPVDADIPQGSLVSAILFTIYLSGLIKLFEERVSGSKGMSFVDDFGLMVTGNDLDQVRQKLRNGVRVSINWADRRELLFGTAETEVALFTSTRGYKNHLTPKVSAKTRDANSLGKFDWNATRCLWAWIDTHTTFKEQHI